MLQRLFGIVVALLVVVLAVVFASLALGVVLATALLAWTWASWRGRGRRRAGMVIEGEFRDETALERLSNLNRR